MEWDNDTAKIIVVSTALSVRDGSHLAVLNYCSLPVLS